jgi:hypothetical protein
MSETLALKRAHRTSAKGDGRSRQRWIPVVDKLQPGSLATWQARRTLAYIEANLASKLDIDDWQM